MNRIRRSAERGHFDHGWLDTFHTFSFAGYHDPAHMGFRALRVINDDRVAPGEGFGMHPHRDMEILTWVLDGALAHEDSMGHRQVLRPGEIQRMSAGTGVMHSEFNDSTEEPVHLLQIWLLPERKGIEPSYEQKPFPLDGRTNRLRLLAAPDARDGAVRIHTDAELHVATLDDGARVEHALPPDRHAWLHVARGRVEAFGHELDAGDALAISEESAVSVRALQADSEILLFDLG